MTGRQLAVWATVLALVATTLLAGANPAGGSTAPSGEQRSIETRAQRWGYGGLQWTATCTGVNQFRATSASVRAFANGQRIKGIHFKYRLVPADTEGQPQFPYNWSDNEKVSFRQGSSWRGRIGAGQLGQTQSSLADWDLEVKLKAPRSLRRAFRSKFRFDIAEPDCSSFFPPSTGGGSIPVTPVS